MPDQGIFTVKDGSVTPFLTNKIFRDNVVINMFKIDNEYIILTEDAGFYKFLNGELSEWSTDLDPNKLTVYSATLSSDNSILIGTIGSGFIKLSLSGKVVEKLNKSNGLINNTVLSIFEDKNLNIWLALDNGISVINDKSPFRIFNDLDGKLGAVMLTKNLKIFLT
ncbi:MAG: hypothetical protein CM15mP102_14230 [Flavobacteriales bacterium]|nr:MAG: hypothetical protein CM15mP102_14230 [Flavobacteriales bacterium]